MSQLKPELVRNSWFNSIAGGGATNYEALNLTNATADETSRFHPLNHPGRLVFPANRRGQDYVYKGDKSWRITFDSAAIAADFGARQRDDESRGIPTLAGQKYSVLLAARCNVANNLARFRIIGLDAANVDFAYLRPAGGVSHHQATNGKGFEFTTTLTNMDLPLQVDWTVYGFTFDVPQEVLSVSFEFENGSAGVHVIDWGELSMKEQSYRLVGA